MMIVSLISADSNMNDENRKDNIAALEHLLTSLKDDALRQKLIDYADHGIAILKNELNKNTNL